VVSAFCESGEGTSHRRRRRHHHGGTPPRTATKAASTKVRSPEDDDDDEVWTPLVGLGSTDEVLEDVLLEDLVVDDGGSFGLGVEEPDEERELQVEIEGHEGEHEVERRHDDLEGREEEPVRDPHGRVVERLVGEEPGGNEK